MCGICIHLCINFGTNVLHCCAFTENELKVNANRTQTMCIHHSLAENPFTLVWMHHRLLRIPVVNRWMFWPSQVMRWNVIFLQNDWCTTKHLWFNPCCSVIDTAIPSSSHRIPFRIAKLSLTGPFSTGVGDHSGSSWCCIAFFCPYLNELTQLPQEQCSITYANLC